MHYFKSNALNSYLLCRKSHLICQNYHQRFKLTPHISAAQSRKDESISAAICFKCIGFLANTPEFKLLNLFSKTVNHDQAECSLGDDYLVSGKKYPNGFSNEESAMRYLPFERSAQTI